MFSMQFVLGFAFNNIGTLRYKSVICCVSGSRRHTDFFKIREIRKDYSDRQHSNLQRS